MENYSLNINGENKAIENVPEDMPLLWVIRDLLGLHGTKFGCGEGLGSLRRLYSSHGRAGDQIV
jgi:isoquinoline 1-oxidoreductase alpha subunit